MQIEETALPGVYLLTPKRFGDHRGFFSETWNGKTLREAGLDLPEFVQDNHSISHQVNTVRGLHYQAPPYAQGKLVRCGRGALFDAVVDVRRGSPTYGQWVGAELSFENGRQLWVPEGFLHGFVTRAPDTEIIYKCTAHYARGHDGAVLWDDPDIAINWGISPEEAILSEKDAAAQNFRNFATPFSYDAAP